MFGHKIPHLYRKKGIIVSKQYIIGWSLRVPYNHISFGEVYIEIQGCEIFTSAKS